MGNERILRVWTDEQDRIKQIIEGDERVFHDLVQLHYLNVYNLSYKLLNNEEDAIEVTQDTFVKVYNTLNTFRGEASLKTWIMRIVMRLSLNKRRDRGRSAWERLGLHKNYEPENAPGDQQTPEAALISAETNKQVRVLVDQLPENMRETLILNSFEDLSYDEIGQILGVPIGTVSSRLYAARKTLSKQLKACGLI